MTNYLEQLFSDKKIIKRVKEKMPYLFQLAEIDSSRAGKLGMEVGSVRERIIIALLIYKFGEENIDTDLPITEAETDVILFDQPISIKTISGDLTGVKLIWTVDAEKSLAFKTNYRPSIDLLLVNINWGGKGSFYYLPAVSQLKVYEKLGVDKYFKMPKPGTNPRGVEITKQALELISKEKESKSIEIDWIRGEMDCDVYDRWVELWGE